MSTFQPPKFKEIKIFLKKLKPQKNLPELPMRAEKPRLEAPKVNFRRFFPNKIVWLVVLNIFVSSLFGLLAGSLAGIYFNLGSTNYLKKLKAEFPGNGISQFLEKEVSLTEA